MGMKKWTAAGLVALGILMLMVSAPRAELRIDITRGNVDPIPVAVTSFIGQAADEVRYGRQIAQVINADLERSGLFAPVDEKAFVDVERSLDIVPRFQNWRILKAQALAQGRVTILSNNRMRVQFRLWDV
ncbi:MAG: Tol-Pal system protein TolB, partial [Rhodospirillaceae bacterium]